MTWRDHLLSGLIVGLVGYAQARGWVSRDTVLFYCGVFVCFLFACVIWG